MPYFTFGPSWVAHLSSWGHPQSIFFPFLEDSYAHFNPGEKVETLGIGGSPPVWKMGEAHTSVENHGLARVG
jgi:hypothetical protein